MNKELWKKIKRDGDYTEDSITYKEVTYYFDDIKRYNCEFTSPSALNPIQGDLTESFFFYKVTGRYLPNHFKNYLKGVGAKGFEKIEHLECILNKSNLEFTNLVFTGLDHSLSWTDFSSENYEIGLKSARTNKVALLTLRNAGTSFLGTSGTTKQELISNLEYKIAEISKVDLIKELFPVSLKKRIIVCVEPSGCYIIDIDDLINEINSLDFSKITFSKSKDTLIIDKSLSFRAKNSDGEGSSIKIQTDFKGPKLSKIKKSV